MYILNELLQKTIDSGASDLHLTVGVPPTVRLNGKLSSIGEVNLEPEDVEKFAREILKENYDKYLKEGEIDTS